MPTRSPTRARKVPASDKPAPGSFAARCAERLVFLRKRKGLTQEDVAALCGVTARTVSNWEQGRVELKYRHMELLAAEYNLKSPKSILAE